jgi:dTDP-4-dehydrorhamnose 3,5-epimerase
MIFAATPLVGAFIIDIEPVEDERGFFARSFCAEAFAARGLRSHFLQCGISHNRRRGILRGLHFQAPPHEEVKLIRCTAGKVFDVMVDLRAHSPTRGQWFATQLSAENHRMVYIPEGFAHGFQVLEDGSELFYQISEPYEPTLSRGLRWNDPDIGIAWPLPDETFLSPRDQELPFLCEIDL